ncbi:hypothetical protein PtB15_16B412 [Puccinia triticina]|nr:hypothetical protein PtB15_16B412 [Puccinia triticina]
MEPATPKRPFAEVEPLGNDQAFKHFRANLPPEEGPNSKEAFRLFWNEAGDMTLEGFCRRLGVHDQRLKDQAVQLAFLRNHPGYSTNEAITVPQMSEALKYRNNGAELYLKSLLNKPAREALASGISIEIIKKGTPNEELLKQWFDYNCPKNLQPEEVTDFSKAVSKKIDHHYGSFQKNPNNKASTLLKKAAADMFTQTEGIHPSFNVLLAIDEARALLSSPKKIPNEFSFFRNFRRALQHIPPNKGFFTILADTTSQVANFNPAPNPNQFAYILERIDVGRSTGQLWNSSLWSILARCASRVNEPIGSLQPHHQLSTIQATLFKSAAPTAKPQQTSSPRIARYYNPAKAQRHFALELRASFIACSSL